LLSAIVACERASEQSAATANEQDDFGHVVPVGRAARIVSLNPATTELLFALGAGDRVVGRTSWDTHPAEVLRARDLGPGIRPSVEAVLETRPDLVLLYASADNRTSAERLRSAGVATLSLKLDRIRELDRAARLVGNATGAEGRAREVVDTVYATLRRVRAATAARTRPTAFWHVWDAPLITIGSGSFLHELLEIAGGRNVYEDFSSPSPRVALEDLIARDPDVVLAGPAGARLIRADPRWRALRAVRENRLRVIDTMLVARPSVRLGEAAVSLARLLHPGSL
jgi:ABC-type Fe3+-hydroxamate transport system substrate-binding protein